jgi:energy-converting hydrogenase Eha subunit H
MREYSRRTVICGMLAYMRIVPLICGLATTGALVASDAYRRSGSPIRSE